MREHPFEFVFLFTAIVTFVIMGIICFITPLKARNTRLEKPRVVFELWGGNVINVRFNFAVPKEYQRAFTELVGKLDSISDVPGFDRYGMKFHAYYKRQLIGTDGMVHKYPPTRKQAIKDIRELFERELQNGILRPLVTSAHDWKKRQWRLG